MARLFLGPHLVIFFSEVTWHKSVVVLLKHRPHVMVWRVMGTLVANNDVIYW